MKPMGAWKTVVVAKSGTTSDEIDLGSDFKSVEVLIPALDSATVAIHISDISGGTFYPKHEMDKDATGSFAHATTADTAAKAVRFICGAQFCKIVCGAAQTSAARTFKIRGID